MKNRMTYSTLGTNIADSMDYIYSMLVEIQHTDTMYMGNKENIFYFISEYFRILLPTMGPLINYKF